MLQACAMQGVPTEARIIQGSRGSGRSLVHLYPCSSIRGNTLRVHSSLYFLNKPRSCRIVPCTVCCVTHKEISHAPSVSRAVVIGGGMAGLAAASSLSSIFEKVTLLERDTFPAQSEVRHCHSTCCRSCVSNVRKLTCCVDISFVKQAALL